MPELPEVETIARALRQGGRGGEPVVGRTIAGALLLWERTLAAPSPAEFLARAPGQAIQAVGRRGKFLVISLNDDYLLIHLRMTGDLRVEPGLDDSGRPAQLLPHDRLVIEFVDGMRMAFNDARKFGRVWLVADPERVLGGLGPEPLDPDLGIEEFAERLHRVNRQLKPLLMDQAFVAGLGNIYTDEALHMAGIHPLRISSTLTREEARRLLESIRAVLREGIQRNGASFDWAYRGGDFQNSFQVYQRAGEPCPQCGTPVSRIIVGQRSTHYCPSCQPSN